MLAHIRAQVDQQYVHYRDLKSLRLQAVTTFCFLRLFVPAIMEPYEYNVTHGTWPDFCYQLAIFDRFRLCSHSQVLQRLPLDEVLNKLVK